MKKKTRKALSANSSPDSQMPRVQWVYEALLNSIQGGRYRRGERIREVELARTLGVSRTPVREALSRLVTRGLLEMTPFGLAVAELTEPQMIELYAMREMLEGSAARFAAEHSSPGEVATLRRYALMFERAIGDCAKLVQINRRLHAAIFATAHNRYLMRSIDEVQDTMALLPNTTYEAPGRPEQAVIEHKKIIDAIERRQPDEAEKLAREHIRNAQALRLQMMMDIPEVVPSIKLEL